MGCHGNVMTLYVIFWHLFWSKKTSKFYGNVMTFWWDSTGFLWEKCIPVKCHENVMKFQCHSMGLKFWFILMVFLWEKSMELSWDLRHFRPKLRWESMMAFYYEGRFILKFEDFPWNFLSREYISCKRIASVLCAAFTVHNG